MNIVILKGRLTAAPDIRDNRARFTVAVDARSKDGTRVAEFIDCTAFDRTADFIGKYFSKGQEILVEGRLHVYEYTAQDGAKRRGTSVTVNNVEFCGSKAAAQPQTADGFVAVKEEALPF